VVPISVTLGITRRGNLTFDVERYLVKTTIEYNGSTKKSKYSPHQFKFTIRRYETDCPVGVKFVQSNALVEATVIQLHSITDAPLILIDDEFVIQSEFALWCSGEICTHLDVAIHICAEYSA
jgi:hypothetical protein